MVSRWAARTPVDVEIPFDMMLGDTVVRGRIDAVFGDGDGGFTVVDWKTGEPPGSSVDLRHNAIQLAVYRLAWAAMQGVPVESVGAAFHYVRSGRTVVPDALPGADELAELLREEPPSVGALRYTLSAWVIIGYLQRQAGDHRDAGRPALVPEHPDRVDVGREHADEQRDGRQRAESTGARHQQQRAGRGLADAGGQRVEPRRCRAVRRERSSRTASARRSAVRPCRRASRPSAGPGLAGRVVDAGVREVMVTLCCVAPPADDGPSWPRVGCVVGSRRSIRT